MGRPLVQFGFPRLRVKASLRQFNDTPQDSLRARGHNRFQNRIGGEKERSLIDNGLSLRLKGPRPEDWPFHAATCLALVLF